MSTEKRPWAEDLAEARQFTAALSASLPSKVEIAALGVLSKAPFQLLTIREALIWRTEELARNACDALEKEDFAVTALLTRGITESAAMTWYLMEILEQRAQHTGTAERKAHAYVWWLEEMAGDANGNQRPHIRKAHGQKATGL